MFGVSMYSMYTAQNYKYVYKKLPLLKNERFWVVNECYNYSLIWKGFEFIIIITDSRLRNIFMNFNNIRMQWTGAYLICVCICDMAEKHILMTSKKYRY